MPFVSKTRRGARAVVTGAAVMVVLSSALTVPGSFSPAGVPASADASSAGASPASPAAVPQASADRPRAAEPSTQGPYAVRTRTYDLGDTAFRPTKFPGRVELRGVVHAPEHAQGRRLPMVVFLHGRHVACGRANGDVQHDMWPCRAPYHSIPSYRGYDYVGRRLASHGYVVVSVSANGINALDAEDDNFGQRARGELVQKHLDLWRQWTGRDGDGPFGTAYRGAIDFDRIGTMGHSRGGEGVVHQWEINAQAGRPYGIRAVLPLAPTDFYRKAPTGVPLATMLPTCDGDVIDLQGARYYDDARYAANGDRAPKHLVAIPGANHNFFNTAWSPSSGQPGAADDWAVVEQAGARGGACAKKESTRLTEDEQRAVGAAYISSFFRLYLGHERGFAGLWRGAHRPPPSASAAKVTMTYQAPDHRLRRLDVNRLGTREDLTDNALGGQVGLTGLVRPKLCGGPGASARWCLAGEYAERPDLQPHGPSEDLTDGGFQPGMNLLRLRWDSPEATFRNDLPRGEGLAVHYRTLRFRGAVDFSDRRNRPDRAVPLRVVLTDGRGHQASVDASAYGEALAYPKLVTTFDNAGDGQPRRIRRLLTYQVRIPLDDFSGVNLADVRSVKLRASARDRGGVVLTDLVFSR